MENSNLQNKSTNLTYLIDQSLNSVNRETREKYSEIVKDPLFTPIYDISIRDQKELAQRRLKKVAEFKLVSVKDFKRDPENIFTMHEMVISFSLNNFIYTYFIFNSC
jgi:hypothetical protein